MWKASSSERASNSSKVIGYPASFSSIDYFLKGFLWPSVKSTLNAPLKKLNTSRWTWYRVQFLLSHYILGMLTGFIERYDEYWFFKGCVMNVTAFVQSSLI